MNRTGLAVVGLAVAMVLCIVPARVAAHDIPTDVTVQAFVKPGADGLTVLVRVPLRAMRDVDVPTRGTGNLDLARADRVLRDAALVWIADNIELYENGARLPAPRLNAALVSLPSDRSFASYDSALAHVTGPPLPAETEIFWDQGMLDVLFEYPTRSVRSQFAVRPTFARLALRVVTVLRFLPPDGGVRAFELVGDPGLVRLDPRWHQAAWRFVQLGFVHILDGTDHLLFLVCLVIPFRRLRPLVAIVTAFTAAHSITLIASAIDLAPDALWFPPLVETLISGSIVYMALENIVISGQPAVVASVVRAPVRRWGIAFVFGLVHGFGFSFALKQVLQFAGSHLLVSLVSFNVGIELGQLFVLLLLIPVLELAFRFVMAERIGTIIVSALVAHTAWHWTLDRAERLREFRLPDVDVALFAGAVRWLLFVVMLAAMIWLASVVVRVVKVLAVPRVRQVPGMQPERAEHPEHH